ncbi:adapter molecule Crk-like [Argonauta hians]
MAGAFDPEDKNSWFFGPMAREEANEILKHETSSGIFLVRESQTMRGNLVLSVKEDCKMSHYIINRSQQGTIATFKIGDHEFNSMPSLLSFYKTHYLDSTCLIAPAPRMKIRAKYDFAGNDEEDLPFKKGEILEVISKDEEKWWTAKNERGETGQIPVPYIEKYDPNQQQRLSNSQNREPNPILNSMLTPTSINPKVKLPARAKVKQQRIPNIYDKTQLKLEVGEIVTVTKINANGQWEGEVNGKIGIFPFTHVEFIGEIPEEDHENNSGNVFVSPLS